MKLPVGLTPEQVVMLAAVLGGGILSLLPMRMPDLRWLKKRQPKGGSISVGPITLRDGDRMRHTHILGSTGSGKTVLIEHLLYRDLARGLGAIIIDAKGERDFYERVRRYCERIGRAQDLHYLSSTQIEESVRWNPCRLGSSSELQSKFFGSAKYENSFYAKACELALLQAFNRLSDQQSLNLGDLVRELDRISNGGKDENLKGLYFDIQNLSSGEWAPVLGTAPKPGIQNEISLLNVIRKNEILFLDLPTEGKAVQSSRLGALVLQEISLISGIRKRNPGMKSDRPFSVYVDEFDAFATDPFISFLNKGRSSEFMIHLAHQTLSDLKKVSHTFEGQLMGNINNRFIFRLDVPEDAERLSKFFGTKTVTKQTFQTEGGSVTGRGSAREVQEFEVHPDSIKTLPTGQCVVSIKTSGFLSVVGIPPLLDRNLPSPKQPVDREPLRIEAPQTEVPQSEAPSKRTSKGASMFDEITQLIQTERKGNV
ncbi:MAG: type IV secretion system DNA-binding domain-containing protein [Bdellovibrionales bacterium]|nr:type IV secretion system DNA-binding domain-containing protein [Bdellovibrionales bacterium]